MRRREEDWFSDAMRHIANAHFICAGLLTIVLIVILVGAKLASMFAR